MQFIFRDGVVQGCGRGDFIVRRAKIFGKEGSWGIASSNVNFITMPMHNNTFLIKIIGPLDNLKKKMTVFAYFASTSQVSRLEFARKHQKWDIEKWKKVYISNKKKFNLDVPGGLQWYWHDRDAS